MNLGKVWVRSVLSVHNRTIRTHGDEYNINKSKEVTWGNLWEGKELTWMDQTVEG